MKVERLISIIMILLDKKRIGAQELAELFEVSPRTIYRDIDSINRAGIPIRSTSGVGGGFEIMEQYKLDKKVFSTVELSTLLLGLSSLPDTMHGTETQHALAKIKSFIPTEQAQAIELKTNQIKIDLSPWEGNLNTQPYLEMIKTALRKNEVISFDYTDQNGNQTARNVEPYQLVLKGNHWYLHGYCDQRNDFRLFKLTRLSNLQLPNDTFTPREHHPPQLNFSDNPATTQTEITLRIHYSVLDRILDYCTYEALSPDGDQHFILRLPFIENDYYYNILFSFGDKCECLAPPCVREEIKRRIQKMANLYEQ
ncbi:YafY family protein [Enterococcus devriesei]|uniref:helix-turn-helix transcriptional regulator n=1 Tax=Enterococcus devriesei TaxID=319970 RepID=UPI0028A70672|nr:YafY family protein [Enterococcus devriesei]